MTAYDDIRTTCHMTSHVMTLHVHHMIVGTCTLLHIVHGMCVNDYIELHTNLHGTPAPLHGHLGLYLGLSHSGMAHLLP